MTFRAKLLVVSSLTLAGAVTLATGAVSILTRRSFDRIDQERRRALIGQLQKQLDAQSRELEHKVERIAAGDPVFRLAVESSRPAPDFSTHYDDAQALAESQSIDFLDLLQADTTIISSAHWPARFGYKNDWQIAPQDWTGTEAFLTRIPLPEGTAVALVAVRPVAVGDKAGDKVGDKKILVAAGKRLDPAFLASLGAAPGMRAFVWLSPREVIHSNDDPKAATEPGATERISALAEQVRRSMQPASGTIQWTADRASTEALYGLPLERHGTLLGILFVATSLAEQVWLERSILWTGVLVGLGGILLGSLIGWWATERVTRPVAALSAGVRAVASGDWESRVAVSSKDEIGELARAFNQMTGQLLEQRDRTVQAERVAAWRELARRLAHELKNPLFPLQITVENLQQARDRHPEQFDEVFRESTSTLLAEIGNLKTIIGRFSDFAKMPVPQFEAADVNEIVREVAKLLAPQLRESRPPIELSTELAPGDATASIDIDQVRRALRNLVLNAMDAMRDGGTLTISTAAIEDGIRIVVADTGQGLSEEECARLFTPYYTTKSHGTGLGLAIVQSVVSDHGGKISVTSAPGGGARFQIDLPARRT